MKKLLTGAMIFGTFATAAYAAPRGTVEVGFETERVNSRYEDSSFILPYVKTKTFFNETTPYYMEANYSFRYHDKNRGGTDEKAKDKRQRYELYVGGYSLTNGNFAFAPKVGVRHEEFSNQVDGRAERSVFRFYPNMSYKIDETNALSLGGFIATISDKRTGKGRNGDVDSYDKRQSDYLHELEFAHTYRLNDRQTFTTSIYNEYESNQYQGTNEIWELRFKFNYALVNGKTKVSPFVRLPINRESREVQKDGTRETVDTDRTRVGVSASHQVNEDWTMLGETWYQTQTKEDGPSKDTVFLKLAMRYSY